MCASIDHSLTAAVWEIMQQDSRFPSSLLEQSWRGNVSDEIIVLNGIKWKVIVPVPTLPEQIGSGLIKLHGLL